MNINDSVKKILKEQMWYLATFADEPNVVPVGFKNVTDDGTLIIGDVFLETTIKNVTANGKIAIAVTDLATSTGYQIKGKAQYLTQGPVVEQLQKTAAEMFKGAMAVKGALIVTPEKIIVTTPGPDNKKEL